MSYRAKASARSARARDKFQLRAAPLVKAAEVSARRFGHEAGRRAAEDALTSVFFASEGAEARINDPKERVIVVPWPRVPSFSLCPASSYNISTERYRTEHFRYVPWAMELNGAHIRWWNLEPDTEDGRRKMFRPMGAALSKVRLAEAIISSHRVLELSAQREVRDLLQQSIRHLAEDIADPRLALSVAR